MSAAGRRLAGLGFVCLLLLGAGGEGIREFGESDRVQRVSAEELLTLLVQRKDPDEGPIVIDTRGAMLYARDHIPGAISVHSADIISGEADLEPYRERGMILYCSNGARSRRSTLYLSGQGFKKIFFLDGMIRNWRFSGYPLESSVAPSAEETPAEEGAESE